MSGTFVALRHNHPGANSVGPLCSIVSKCCRGELSWEQVDCSECSRRMWRQPLRESSTRDWHEDRCCIKPDVDTSRVCFDCKKELRVKNLMPPQPPPVLAGAREYTSEIGEDLGISVETFRALKLLQQREITPNDYDLLMRYEPHSACQCNKCSPDLPMLAFAPRPPAGAQATHQELDEDPRRKDPLDRLRDFPCQCRRPTQTQRERALCCLPLRDGGRRGTHAPLVPRQAHLPLALHPRM